ncbi:MAG: class I SAM-dependent methyltransferase [Nitrospirae bacterium]|nr:class I SAM-dependent methyltransferase [Nitrospirota bacterium]
MGFPSADIINNIIFNKHLNSGRRFILPDNISQSIEKCLESSNSDINNASHVLKDQLRGNYSSSKHTEYTNVAVVDAYTIEYLPRYFFIPHIIFRDLALCRELVGFGITIRILDMGSGTGAVSLGVYDLFSNDTFNDYSVDLVAVDKSEAALTRQFCLINQVGFRYDLFHCEALDISDIDKVSQFLKRNKPWDIIISANFIVELDVHIQKSLIALLSRYLSEFGSLVICEPPQDYAKIIIHNIADVIKDSGLTVYYPCSAPWSCKPKKVKCWIWRDYDIIDPIKPISREDESIELNSTKLQMSLVILNKCNKSILEFFKNNRPDLTWSIVSPKFGGFYEICPSHKTFYSDKPYNRGDLVGWREGSNGTVDVVVHERL